MSKQQRKKECIRIGLKRSNNLLDNQKKKVVPTKLVAGGPKFAKSVIAGNLSTSANLGQIIAQQAEISTARDQARKEEIELKKKKKADAEAKKDAIKNKNRSQVQEKDHEIRLLDRLQIRIGAS